MGMAKTLEAGRLRQSVAANMPGTVYFRSHDINNLRLGRLMIKPKPSKTTHAADKSLNPAVDHKIRTSSAYTRVDIYWPDPS